MKKTIMLLLIVLMLFSSYNLYAFKNGAVMNIVTEVGASSTLPEISDSDLKKLNANKMEGMTSFIAGGLAEVGYIFGVEEFMGFENDNIFSGIGVFGYLGVGQGYAGQISGADVNGEQIDVFFNIFYSPVISAGVAVKFYFIKNRIALGLAVGTKVIADLQPSYEMYSTDPDVFAPEVGTIIVEDWMLEKMNPFMVSLKTTLEYNVPILDTLEFIVGGYLAYNIYTPKYITMPPKLLEAAIAQTGFNPMDPIKSYYINSLEYGLRAGVGIKL